MDDRELAREAEREVWLSRMAAAGRVDEKGWVRADPAEDAARADRVPTYAEDREAYEDRRIARAEDHAAGGYGDSADEAHRYEDWMLGVEEG